MGDNNISVDDNHIENKDETKEVKEIIDSTEKQKQTEKSTEAEKLKEGEIADDQIENERAEREQLEGEEIAGEEVEGEHVEDEHGGDEHIEGEQVDGEQVECKQIEDEQVEDEEVVAEQKEEQKPVEDEVVEEEEGYVEEPPPDPAAPYEFSDSKEALKAPFALRPDQLAEVEQLWETYQNYTPAYTDIDGYITEKELVYMLKSLILMTYTPEQLQELIAFCVRPPHPLGHINYDQFLKMVTIRQRDFPVEDELRSALQVFDPGRTGSVDREYLKEVLSKQGHKMPQKQLDNFIKEVDLSNDGTIGIEDVIGTMCIDLNKDDILMLMESLNPPTENPPEEI